MCRHITYILPREAEEGDFFEAFELMGIRVWPALSKNLAPIIGRQEQAWIRHNDCDCGIPIGETNIADEQQFADTLADAEKRYRRKGCAKQKSRGRW